MRRRRPRERNLKRTSMPPKNSKSWVGRLKSSELIPKVSTSIIYKIIANIIHG